MSETLVLWVVRLVGVVIVALLLRSARNVYLRRRLQLEQRILQQAGNGSAVAVQEQSTARLNPSFLGKKNLPPSADALPDAPMLDLPLSIMARVGQHFSGDDVLNLVRTFGLQRSPSGVYELLNANGRDVLFTMLNIHQPGVFAQDLTQMSPIDGLMLVLQLPNCGDAVKDWDNFLAIAKDMEAVCAGRLCDHERKQMVARDLLAYRQAVEKYQKSYEQWLAQSQK